MVTRTKCGWMALGGLLVLFGVVLACKLRDGSRAQAQSDPPAPALADVKTEKETPPPLAGEETSRVLPAIGSAVPSLNTPPPPMPSAKPASFSPVQKTGSGAPPPPPAPEVLPAAAEPAPPGAGESKPILIPASATLPPATEKAPPPEVKPESKPVSPPPPPAERRETKPVAPPPPPEVKVESTPAPPPAPPTDSAPPPPASSPPPPDARTGGAAPLPPVTSGPPAPPPVVKVTVPPVKVEVKDGVDEPPLAPSPGPVVIYRVTAGGETFKSLARKTLGTVERWTDIHKLNPSLKADAHLAVGAAVRLPGDACVPEEETIRPLPPLRVRQATKGKAVLPLTGTFPVTLDEGKVLTLPRGILEQLGGCDTVLVSPGSDKCLWLTNQAHLDRLAHKLEKSPARESDKSGFKRLYYAQTIKAPMKGGRVAITDRLAAFAGLHHEVVLVGIDDHFEVWDVARWRKYTQRKKASLMEE
jgi:division/cell wall cluster transcriptional repressor MraZ